MEKFRDEAHSKIKATAMATELGVKVVEDAGEEEEDEGEC